MKLHLTGLVLLTLCLLAPHNNVDAQERATLLKGPKNATSQYSGLEYGPIDSQDTLWRIAERYRQNNNLSVYQVMSAIYELNPNAFEQQNLNLLVDGSILKLPSERYISRIDARQAQIRAESDERTFAELLNKPGSSVRNIKPPAPLVNQNDLSQTQSNIEQKITRLDQEQTRQFDELRMQFAASLENVEALLNENRKLYERVDEVNGELQELRNQVEGDVKTQIDTQVALQQELLDMMKAEQMQREAEKQKSMWSSLSSPMLLIIGSGIITLLLVGGLIAWLLKRKPAEAAEAPEVPEISDDVPVPDTDMADLASALEPDLGDSMELTDDDLFNDDDLLDDVLTSELEESLDDDLETFGDLDDDMLVPDDDTDDLFESGSDELDQNELDSLFDDDDLSDKLSEDENTSLEGFDLSGDDDDDLANFDDSLDADLDEELDEAQDDTDFEEAPDASEPDALDDDFDIDDILDGAMAEAETSDSVDDIFEAAQSASNESEEDTATLPSVDDEDETPEISIDDLLEQNAPEPTLLDELDSKDELINEDMIDKLDDEINQQNQELDRITDDLLNEIEQIEMMGGLDEGDEDSEK